MPSLDEAKARLDKLIGKTRDKFYKPIAVAELLYRHRVEGSVDPAKLEDYRRRSDDWCKQVYPRLFGKAKKPSNARYGDQLFDPPTIQVKRLSLSQEDVAAICDCISGDQIAPELATTLGADLLARLALELAFEFPMTQAQRVQTFLSERGYDVSRLVGRWCMRGIEES